MSDIVGNNQVFWPYWPSVFIKTCKKYNMIKNLFNAVSTGNYMSIMEWKRMMKKRIVENDRKRNMIQCQLYKVLSNMTIGNNIRCSIWLIFAF